MRRALLVLAGAVLLLAGVLAVVGGGGGGGGSGGAGGVAPTTTGAAARERKDDADALETLLAKRGRALRSRNAGALARTTTPGPMRSADRERVARLRGLRLTSVRYVATDLTFGRRLATIRVLETYRVAGVSGSTFSVSRTYRAARGRNGWRLTGERLGAARQPWELTPLRELRSPRFVVLAPAELDVEAQGLQDALERAYAAIGGAGVGKTARRYLVVVARTVAEARRLATHISGLESLVAVADTNVREEGLAQRPAAIVSARLVLIWPTYVRLDAGARLMILEHELTHLVTAPYSSGRLPGWLVEGLALYVSGDRRTAEAARDITRRVPSLRALSDPDALARLDGSDQAAAYASASSAAFYIADRYGRRSLLRLYRSFDDERLAGKPGPVLVDTALRRVLHRSLAGFERDLRRWIVAREAVAPLAP